MLDNFFLSCSNLSFTANLHFSQTSNFISVATSGSFFEEIIAISSLNVVELVSDLEESIALLVNLGALVGVVLIGLLNNSSILILATDGLLFNVLVGEGDLLLLRSAIDFLGDSLGGDGANDRFDIEFVSLELDDPYDCSKLETDLDGDIGADTLVGEPFVA